MCALIACIVWLVQASVSDMYVHRTEGDGYDSDSEVYAAAKAADAGGECPLRFATSIHSVKCMCNAMSASAPSMIRGDCVWSVMMCLLLYRYAVPGNLPLCFHVTTPKDSCLSFRASAVSLSHVCHVQCTMMMATWLVRAACPLD